MFESVSIRMCSKWKWMQRITEDLFLRKILEVEVNTSSVFKTRGVVWTEMIYLVSWTILIAYCSAINEKSVVLFNSLLVLLSYFLSWRLEKWKRKQSKSSEFSLHLDNLLENYWQSESNFDIFQIIHSWLLSIK